MSEIGKPSSFEEEIVFYLRAHLKISMTLFQFSEIRGRDLIDLLNSVVHALSADQPEKIGTEKIEDTVSRISEFLRVLNYQFPVSPEEWDNRFLDGDKELLYPVFLFLLNDFDGMKRKAYLARFNTEIYVPDELKSDSIIEELAKAHLELREHFDAIIAEKDQLGESNVDELKKVYSDLEADRARLATKISGFKRKLEKVPKVDEMLKWTAKLRIESEKELKYQNELQIINNDKRNLMKKQQALTEQMNNLKSEMRKKLNALKQEFESLSSQSAQNNARSPNEMNLKMSQNQVIAAIKRRDQKKKQLTDLQKQRENAEELLRQKQQEGSVEIPSPTEFVQYVRSLKEKNEIYKSKQAELAAIKHELAVMMRTEEIVKQQNESTQNEIQRIERQKGVGGFREARKELEKISSTKADLDDIKGQTLEEISSLAKEIQTAIKSRQSELKPLVNKLQEQRKKKAAIESKYLQAKRRYQNAISEYDSVYLDLDEESKKLRNDIANYQTKYYTTVQLQAGLERTMRRVREEEHANTTGNPISKQIKTYSDYFQKASQSLKKQARDLKEEKKNMGNQTEENQKQLEMFQSLRSLLQVKLECQKESQKRKIKESYENMMEGQNPEEIINIE